MPDELEAGGPLAPAAPATPPSVEQAIADKAAALERELAALRESLDQARASLQTAERRSALHAELARAHVVDAQAALLLLEQDPPSPNLDPDPAHRVAHLKAQRPWLFAAPPLPATPTATRIAEQTPAERQRAAIAALADQAGTGDRRALLHYLRARAARS